jgi:glucans biosynthesis protein C
MIRSKNQSIETLRGVAIILVVMGHVIGYDKTGGMKVSDDSFLRHLYFTFEYLRIPLFTTISGWVYALHPVSFNNWKNFTIKKVRRILLPLVVAGSLYFLLQYFTPGTNSKTPLNEIWKIYIFPFTLYWYLPALFLVFILMSLIDSLKLCEKFTMWFGLTLFFLTIMIFFKNFVPESSPNFFAYKNFIYLLPFFIAGVGMNRFSLILSNRLLVKGLGILLIFMLIIQQLVWYQQINMQLSKDGGLGLMIGVIGSFVLLNIKWKVEWLISVGSFAYTIYLYHAFGTAAGRILPKYVGISNPAFIFTSSFLAGLFIPIAIDYAANRYPFSRMFFLGKSYVKNMKEN